MDARGGGLRFFPKQEASRWGGRPKCRRRGEHYLTLGGVKRLDRAPFLPRFVASRSIHGG